MEALIAAGCIFFYGLMAFLVGLAFHVVDPITRRHSDEEFGRFLAAALWPAGMWYAVYLWATKKVDKREEQKRVAAEQAHKDELERKRLLNEALEELEAM